MNERGRDRYTTESESENDSNANPWLVDYDRVNIAHLEQEIRNLELNGSVAAHSNSDFFGQINFAVTVCNQVGAVSPLRGRQRVNWHLQN